MLGDCFWRLCSPESTHKLAEWAHDEMDLEQIICPTDKGHRRAGKRLTDLSVTLPRETVQDFVWTWQSECLIQDRVLQLFRENKFTGFEVKPVKAKLKAGGTIETPKLLELRVTGWGGVASPQSGIQLIRNCPACGSLKYSGTDHPESIFDESQWDGSDFFFIWPLPKFIFVTDRVAKVIRDHHLTGVRLCTSSELEPIQSAMPGRLHYYLPENRAHELGDPLEIY